VIRVALGLLRLQAERARVDDPAHLRMAAKPSATIALA
jgi:hypothetical protein